MDRRKLTQLATILIIASFLIVGATQRFDKIIAKTIITTSSSGITLNGGGTLDLGSGDMTMNSGDLAVTAGNLTIGNGTPSITQDGEDAYIEGVLEVDGLANFGSVISQPINIENFGNGKTILTQIITFTAAAGGSGTLATITDGEIWFVHKIFIRTTTDFDATGDDVTFIVGDDLDVDGFLAAVDAELQSAFTEATGYAAGWFGIESGSGDAYTLDDGGPFVYAPSGADQTIDWLLDETSGETITAGQLTAYVLYTRIQ